nr:hypothetical protein [Tanacetum cinerariifolium]
MYGDRGSLDNPGLIPRNSLWISIIREFHNLSRKGVNLLKLMKKKVGNGMYTRFWDDPWLFDSLLMHVYPRLYGLKCAKHVTVAAKLSDSSLIDSFRRPPRGGVQEEYLLGLIDNVDSVILSNSIDGFGLLNLHDPTRWIKIVPIKINIFAWKVRLDRLPTRINLSLRGIDLPSIIYPICCCIGETCSHLLFTCNPLQMNRLLRMNQMMKKSVQHVRVRGLKKAKTKYFYCVREGQKARKPIVKETNPNDEKKQRRRRSSCRIGCQAKLVIKRINGNQYISSLNMDPVRVFKLMKEMYGGFEKTCTCYIKNFVNKIIPEGRNEMRSACLGLNSRLWYLLTRPHPTTPPEIPYRTMISSTPSFSLCSRIADGKASHVFKVESAKAYNSVRWDYLIDVLKAFGFGLKICLPHGDRSYAFPYRNAADTDLSISHLESLLFPLCGCTGRNLGSMISSSDMVFLAVWWDEA